jgi:hypothetical protein
MTDYEKASLFVDYLNTSNMVFSNYMAIVFAMLAASWFLAHRMSRLVAILFLALYSIGALMSGFGVFAAFTDFANLGVSIHQTAQTDGGELQWLAPAGPGGAGMGALPVFVAFMVLSAYAGSIVFFFLVRRKKLNLLESTEEVVAAAPDA